MAATTDLKRAEPRGAPTGRIRVAEDMRPKIRGAGGAAARARLPAAAAVARGRRRRLRSHHTYLSRHLGNGCLFCKIAICVCSFSGCSKTDSVVVCMVVHKYA